MAKSMKVEDYWRDNHLENLLKDITQLLARRMPSDPAIAIVEHLQKKFPKSFKTRMQSITSIQSEQQNESLNDMLTERRSSNQSQVSGIVTIPSTESAFTNLLKQNVRIRYFSLLSKCELFVFLEYFSSISTGNQSEKSRFCQSIGSTCGQVGERYSF